MAVNYPSNKPRNGRGYQSPVTKSGLPMSPPANDNWPVPRPNPKVPPPPANDNIRLPTVTKSFRHAMKRWYIGRAIEIGVSVAELAFAVPGEYEDGGWTRVFGPCPIPGEYNGASGFVAMTAPGCIGMQAIPQPYYPGVRSGWTLAMHVTEGEVLPGTIRSYCDIGWSNPGGSGALLLPGQKMGYLPGKVLGIDPFVDPMGQPVTAAQPVPQRLPWAAIPYRPEVPLGEPGYNRGYAVGQEVAPAWVPAIGLRIDPATRAVSPTSPPMYPKPPEPGVKERKLRSRNIAVALAVMNAASEGKDILIDIWQALPKDKQTRIKGQKTSGTQMAKDIWEHLGDVDWNKAIQNIAMDQLVDMFYGTLGNVNRNVSQRVDPHHGLPIGYQAGGWDYHFRP